MRLVRLTTTLAAVLVLGACAGNAPEQPLADDLQRDLNMAGGTAIELAPKAGGQQVVSAIESAPPVPTPAKQKVGRAVDGPGPKKLAVKTVSNVGTSKPQPDLTVQVPEPVRDTTVETPTPAPSPSPEPAIGAGRPTPVPSQRPAPRGGWKTPSEVIRNAPFPINPAVGVR